MELFLVVEMTYQNLKKSKENLFRDILEKKILYFAKKRRYLICLQGYAAFGRC